MKLSPYRYPGRPQRTANWQSALQVYIDSEEEEEEHINNNPNVYYRDENCVVVYDGYPKARMHLLLLPRLPNSINSISELQKKQHLETVKACHERARQIAQHLSREYQETYGHACPGFRLGYHAVPSLNTLHLHIVSLDFDSDCLKNKKHYNSFATTFFVEATRVEAQLEEHGCIRVDAKAEDAKLKQPLQCLWCGYQPRNLPLLKEHLAKCCQEATTTAAASATSTADSDDHALLHPSKKVKREAAAEEEEDQDAFKA